MEKNQESDFLDQLRTDQETAAETQWDIHNRIINQEGDKVDKTLSLSKLETKLARNRRRSEKKKQQLSNPGSNAQQSS